LSRQTKPLLAEWLVALYLRFLGLSLEEMLPGLERGLPTKKKQVLLTLQKSLEPQPLAKKA
jgi:hypothetical protein